MGMPIPPMAIAKASPAGDPPRFDCRWLKLSSYKVVPDRVLDQFGAALCAKHFHYPVLVIRNRSSSHVQNGAHLLHQSSFSQQLQHFTLPVGEAFVLLDHFLMLPPQAIDRWLRQTLRRVRFAT